MKTCCTCKIEKSESEYYRCRGKKDGRAACCKDCADNYNNLYRAKNPEKVRAHKRQSAKRRYTTEKSRASTLRCVYGMTSLDYQRLLDKQGGVCAICGRTGTDATRTALSVDHNHSTGKIRGLLCGPCNRALGMLQDSPELLRKAAAYVEGNQ